MRAIALLVGVGLAVTTLAATTAGTQEPQSIMPALLAEVRGLRAAMEQMAAAGPRVQLALGRLQLQEQRLNTLITRLDATRANLSNMQRQMAQQQAQLSEFESAEKDNPDANERQQAGHMVTMMKRELASTVSEVQRLTAEETSIAGDIASEQGKWQELNARLEELERALERR